MSDAEDFTGHLARDVTTLCHCWRLTRRDGQVSGFTDHDRLLVFEGTSFRPESGFAASEARESLGLGVDTVDVEGALSAPGLTAEDVAAGLYDRAKVETFLVNWQAPAQRELIRVATLGRIVASDGRFVAELESFGHALDQPGGRFITRRCDAELGDDRCRVALNAPGMSGAGTVAAFAAPAILKAAGLDSFAAGWFSHGVIEWQSGALAGRTARVRDHRGGELVLEDVGGGTPAAGDTFIVRAGCDKLFATCKAKFNNHLNFRGFPHLPGNDAAYAYVADGVRFDGKTLVP